MKKSLFAADINRFDMVYVPLPLKSHEMLAAFLLILVAIVMILFIRYVLRHRTAMAEINQAGKATLSEKERNMMQQQLVLEQRIALLERGIHEREFELRNKALMAETLQTVSRIETLHHVEELLSNTRLLKDSQTINIAIRPLYRNEDAWERFRKHFELVYPHFFSRLKKSFPTLSEPELRLAAYMRAKLSNQDMAQLFCLSLAGLHKKRQRLRKKMGLDNKIDFYAIMNQF